MDVSPSRPGVFVAVPFFLRRDNFTTTIPRTSGPAVRCVVWDTAGQERVCFPMRTACRVVFFITFNIDFGHFPVSFAGWELLQRSKGSHYSVQYNI